jgi:hypothetical protein
MLEDAVLGVWEFDREVDLRHATICALDQVEPPDMQVVIVRSTGDTVTVRVLDGHLADPESLLYVEHRGLFEIWGPRPGAPANPYARCSGCGRFRRPSWPVAAPGLQVTLRNSHPSFALLWRFLCRCMFCGPSMPQQARGQMWSMMYPLQRLRVPSSGPPGQGWPS